MFPLIHDQSYEEIIITYFRYYAKEFGERKAISVEEKIKTSNKIAKLIVEADAKRTYPDHLDILTCLNTIPFFIFSSGQTQALGALLALDSWKSNTRYDLANEFYLKNIAINIIKDCSGSFHNRKPNSQAEYNKGMQLSGIYPTDNHVNLFKKIEENVKILMHEFNKIAAKDKNALVQNIHYTVLLPILKEISSKDVIKQENLDKSEKKLLRTIVRETTPVFCIGALMIHSEQFSLIVSTGFNTVTEVKHLLKFVREVILKTNPHSKCVSEITHFDSSLVSYFNREIPEQHRYGILFQNL